MPLNFATGSTTAVNCGTGLATANLDIASFIAWVIIRTDIGTKRIFQRGLTTATFFVGGGTGTIGFQRGRATTNAGTSATTTNFAAFAVDRLLCLAGTLSTSGSASDQKFYIGTRTMPLAEPSSYISQTAGSGTAGDNSSTVMNLGNNGTIFQFAGDIFSIRIWPFLMGLADLQAIAPTFRPLQLRNCAGAWRPGVNGSGLVLDESGLGNHGALVGTPILLSDLYGASQLGLRRPVDMPPLGSGPFPHHLRRAMAGGMTALRGGMA